MAIAGMYLNCTFSWNLLTITVCLDIQDYLSLMLAKLRIQKTGSIYTTQPVHAYFFPLIVDKFLASSFAEKLSSILGALRLIKKPVIQEVYVMENGTKVSK
ncbi:hypothetical protein N7453_003377 [Penicillium expansum]|nr:hypothetical protein N7453_003377 [Penicillium expansum]